MCYLKEVRDIQGTCALFYYIKLILPCLSYFAFAVFQTIHLLLDILLCFYCTPRFLPHLSNKQGDNPLAHLRRHYSGLARLLSCSFTDIIICPSSAKHIHYDFGIIMHRWITNENLNSRSCGINGILLGIYCFYNFAKR